MKTVLILNPIHSPAYLSEKFKRADFYTIACFTSEKIDNLTNPIIEKKLFDEFLFIDHNLDSAITKIQSILDSKKLDLRFAFSSSEFDLYYSDMVVQVFCPEYANDPKTSGLRCDKRLMNLQLQKNGTAAARQQVVDNISQIDWNSLKFPLVVKPAEGGMGSVGVSICNTPTMLHRYFTDISRQRWGYGFAPDHFLLEELLIGQEYAVDMVVWKKNYDLVGVYSVDKITHRSHPIPHVRRHCPLESEAARTLAEYCKAVLSNLDVSTGMMHLECMITSAGPRLIELNPRVSGAHGILNYCSEILNGLDQANVLISHFEGENVARKQISHPEKYGAIFYLQNFGFTYTRVYEEIFQSLPTYHRHWLNRPSQADAKFPENLFDTVAYIFLVSESKEQLEQDLQKISKLEKSGLCFDITPTQPSM